MRSAFAFTATLCLAACTQKVGSEGSSASVTSRCRSSLEQGRFMAAPPFDFGRVRVDVLGDSYSVGAELTAPRSHAWDVQLAKQQRWHLTVRGIGATGFVNGGACGDRTYQSRVAQVLADKPQLVIVEGGLNDVGHPGVESAAEQLLASLPSTLRVIVVGPPSAPAFSRGGEQAVDRELRAAVGTTRNREYVSTIHWPLSYARSGIHLSVASHRTFAARLADAIG